MYFTAACDGAPAARVQSNVFGTRYALCLDPSVRPFSTDGDTSAPWHARGGPATPWASDAASPRRSGVRQRGPAPLAEVQYKTRLKGFMRPRRCVPRL